MTFTPKNYVDGVGPDVSAAWLNAVDVLVNSVMAGASTPAQALTALGISPPMTIAGGGTGQTTAAAGLAALGGTSLAAVNQAYIGGQLYPQTAAEVTASVTPANLSYAPLNLLRYKALADPDHVNAFTKAIAVASVAGGAIYVPGGAYTCSTNVNITASNVRVTGDGPSSIINFTDTTHRYSGITFTGTSGTHLANAQVDNVQLVGAGTYGTGNTTGSGVLCNYVDSVRIYAVTAHEWSDNAFACGGVGGGGKNWQISNCTGYNVGQGISLFYPAQNVIVTGNLFYNISLYNGIDIEGTGGADVYAVCANNIVYNCLGPTNQAVGINIEICNYSSVTGNVVYGVLGGGVGSNGSGIHLFGSAYCSVTGNVSYNNSGYGIYVGANSGNGTVVGNTTNGNTNGSSILTDDATAASTNVLINNNNFNEGLTVLSGSVSLVNVFNNTFQNRGIFTVTAVGTTTAGVGTYTSQIGKYTLLDDMVEFQINLAWTAHTGTGSIQINGLPYTSSNSTIYAVTIRANGLPITAGNMLQGNVNQNATTISLWQWAPGTGALSNIPLPASCVGLTICGSYPTV